MNIGIVTVYESIDNFGSYLQTYSMKHFFEQRGHTVYVIQNQSISKPLKKYLCRINPKREFLLRLKKSILFLKDNRHLNILDKNDVEKVNLSCIIYGSDEIWNLENPYFRNSFFWGGLFPNIPKIAYAVSIGAMKMNTEDKYAYLFDKMSSFRKIMVRDEKTLDFVRRRTGENSAIVCDPTMLIPVSSLLEPINIPQKPYLFVYTYGIDANLSKYIKQYAKKWGLLIVSACFWHPWADKTIECSPLQLSSLINGADSVFTSTFHGSLFTMLNHKRCCIFPTREKVQNIVTKLGMEDRLIDDNCSYNQFEIIMRSEFKTERFEEKLMAWRMFSVKKLEDSLLCLTE